MEWTPGNVKIWSKLGTAGTFGVAALGLAEHQRDVVVVTADLRSFSGLDRFAALYPERYFNLGIAEQNMVGVAAGLSHEGFQVFATTYATFAAARALDPVRVNMGYMELGVKLVGLGAGFSVGLLGPTHMSLEDLAVMRAIPNMAVLAPADCGEVIKVIQALAHYDGPAYVRVGGNVPHPVLNHSDYTFEIGRAIEVRSGTDATLISCGSMVGNCLRAADFLKSRGLEVGVINMHTIKPLDVAKLREVFGQSGLVVTVEEHSTIGGLGSAVAEARTLFPNPARQVIMGVPDIYPHAADYEHLVQQAGLSASDIAERILTELDVRSDAV